jgi:hypothetical protein
MDDNDNARCLNARGVQTFFREQARSYSLICTPPDQITSPI